jgi:hypothetical protein
LSTSFSFSSSSPTTTFGILCKRMGRHEQETSYFSSSSSSSSFSFFFSIFLLITSTLLISGTDSIEIKNHDELLFSDSFINPLLNPTCFEDKTCYSLRTYISTSDIRSQFNTSCQTFEPWNQNGGWFCSHYLRYVEIIFSSSSQMIIDGYTPDLAAMSMFMFQGS